MVDNDPTYFRYWYIATPDAWNQGWQYSGSMAVGINHTATVPSRATVGFHSTHPGGAQFAFGDGSVRFVSENVLLDTYRALGTRATGEVIDAGAY
jgi:prepilin-type processing-associated H-X9-DG protein